MLQQLLLPLSCTACSRHSSPVVSLRLKSNPMLVVEVGPVGLEV
jgi:hypothetical protein